jgi:hypothetical protein
MYEAVITVVKDLENQNRTIQIRNIEPSSRTCTTDLIVDRVLSGCGVEG